MYVWFGSLDASPFRVRRPRLFSSPSVLALSTGVGLTAAGGMIQDARSSGAGIATGVIAFVSVVLITIGIAALRRRLRRAGALAR